MNVVMRTDASHLIGTGHMVRCLTLAGYLRAEGAKVLFISRDLPGGLGDLAAQNGFGLTDLPAPDDAHPSANSPDDYASWLGVSQEEDAAQTAEILRSGGLEVDWLVTDHYGLGETWERALRPSVRRLMVIDDLANRPHRCDMLLDQNFYLDLESRYDTLVPASCRRLLGPKYAVLRPEFHAARRRLVPRDGTIRRILVFFGGCDATGETIKCLEALSRLQLANVSFDVVAGMANERREVIAELGADIPGVRCHIRIDDMAEAMIQADLALGGGGTTTWERCYLGLPTITVSVAENQRIMLEAMGSKGAVWHLGNHDEVTVDDLAAALDRAMADPDRIRAIGEAARTILGDRDEDEPCPVVSAMLAEPSPGER
jgi:UDP-2,4-diacetamido-2,4,6-trideoxy-beta-L-altropyranose hydrolase